MNSFSRKLLVPIIILVSLSLTAVLFAPAISAVHAAGSPAITIQPSTQGAKPVNSLLTFNVTVQNMPFTFAGWDISVITNPAVLSPQSIAVCNTTACNVQYSDSGGTNFMPGGTDAQCINGTPSGAFNTCTGNDGFGVAHDAFASSGFTGGALLLFTITYKVTGSGTSSVAFPESMTSGTSQNHVLDNNGIDIAASETGGQYGALPPGFTVSASPSTVGPIETINNGGNGTSTVTVTGQNGFTGIVTLTLTPSSGLTAYLNQSTISLSPAHTSGVAILVVNAGAAGNYNVMVIGTSGGTSHSTTVAVSVVDYTVSVSPTSVGPLPAGSGQTATSTVTVTGQNGIVATVSVSLLSSGLVQSSTLSTCSLSASTTSCRGTITVEAASIHGPYFVTEDATSSVSQGAGATSSSTPVDHQTTLTVHVSDFSVDANPPVVGPLNAGQTSTSQIIVTGFDGFSGIVTFTLTPSSSHLSASISPTSVTFGSSPQTATLTVSFDQIGTYDVLVTGHSTGYPDHSVDVTVLANPTVLILPAVQGVTAPGASVSYNVNEVSMPPFAGYDIMVVTNPSVLSPDSIDVSANVLQPGSEITNCVNGGFSANGTPIPLGSPGNLNCGQSDGPGVAHSAFSSSGFYTGDGLLFTIHFVAGTPDFSISASPTTIGITGAGTTGSSTITVTRVTASGTSLALSNDMIFDPNGNTVAHNSINAVYGTTSFTVSLSVAPSTGLTANISPSSITLSDSTPSGTATLTVSASAGGVYSAVVTGTASGLPGTPSHNTNVTVQVTDFTITASPTSLTIPAGSSGTSTITLRGFGDVTLSTSTLPTGVQAMFTPNPVSLTQSNPTGTSTLTITIASSVGKGSFTLTVTGTDGSITHSTTITVTVSAPAVTFTLHWTHHLSLSKNPAGQTYTGAISNGLSSSIVAAFEITGHSLTNPTLTFDVTCGSNGCFNTAGTPANTPGVTYFTVAAGGSTSFSFSQSMTAFVGNKISFTTTIFYGASSPTTQGTSKSGTFAVVA